MTVSKAALQHAPSIKPNQKAQNEKTVSDRVYEIAVAPFRAIYYIYDSICPWNSLTEERRIKIFPERLEVAFGRYGYRKAIDADGGEWDNAHYKHMVNSIFKKMIPHTGRAHLPWEIKIIDSSSVNAWARMGGKMGINRAFVERAGKDHRTFGLGNLRAEDKIAAVIGHEMSHVAARHSARDFEIAVLFNILLAPWFEVLEELAPLSILLLFSSYSRSQEFEADKLGMKLMHKTGHDLKGAIWVQHFLKDYEDSYGIGWMDWLDRWVWGHPDADERIAANKITLAELKKTPRTLPSKAAAAA